MTVPNLDRRALAAAGLGDDVRAGLDRDGQKSLPSSLLYDDVGSALFEVISVMPEYGLTRADERILRAHAGEIVGLLPGTLRVIELGSGSARKTRSILSEVAKRQLVPYHPIDLSAAAIASCRASLSDLHPVRVEAITAEYLPGLRIATRRRRDGERMLLLFLGSTIGNFSPADSQAFLTSVRELMHVDDALLLGTDLMKPVPWLLSAYADPIGVTAAFDKNVLARINRELDADFDCSGFDHEARWNAVARDVEMHLVARVAHTVTIRALDLEVRFRAGESIWMESSHKFEPDEPVRLGERAGFRCAGQWFDREWPFAETLLVAG